MKKYILSLALLSSVNACNTRTEVTKVDVATKTVDNQESSALINGLSELDAAKVDLSDFEVVPELTRIKRIALWFFLQYHRFSLYVRDKKTSFFALFSRKKTQKESGESEQSA